MKFRPLHDRVVVKRIAAEEKTAGGIIIPDIAREKPQQGEVIAEKSRSIRKDETSCSKSHSARRASPRTFVLETSAPPAGLNFPCSGSRTLEPRED
jgi:hypothetical protein